MDLIDDDISRRLSPNPNLSTKAYHALFDMIASRRLAGGASIVENKLARELGISRTPLREALQRLEGEGLLVKTARYYIVRQVTLPEFINSMRVRELLEGEAAMLSASEVPRSRTSAVRRDIETFWTPEAGQELIWRLDDALHDLMLNHCGNPVMARIIRKVRTTSRLFDRRRSPDWLSESRAEHLRILDALEARDAREVRRAVTAHLKSISQRELGGFI